MSTTKTMDKALGQFDAIEANLAKLDRLWFSISAQLPGTRTVGGVSDETTYRELARAFALIIAAMPKIDGHALENLIRDPNGILEMTLDAAEVDEIGAVESLDAYLHAQASALAEYRFRLRTKRRHAIRLAVGELSKKAEAALVLADLANSETKGLQQLQGQKWEEFCQFVRQISALVGNSVKRPPSWTTLARHMSFAQRHDLNDIVESDWPQFRKALDVLLYADDEPLPLEVNDVATLVGSSSPEKISVKLNWKRLDPTEFERLLFNLISSSPGYEAPEWLMHTNAADDGRDMSVFRVSTDSLAGASRKRVVIACKHWLTKSVGVAEVSTLVAQMTLWNKPRVDVLVIATSGRL